MFDFGAAAEALGVILQPERFGWLFLGALIGLAIGILPGLGGIVGMSILLPFVFGMDPFSGTALLIGMVAAVHTSDTFPSVLIGVPGSAGSQAIIMDGYPLAKRGEGTRALAAAFTVSMVGGVFGAAFLFGAIAVARPLVLLLGSPELFALTILGLSLVGILAKGAPVAGLLAGCFGLFLGTVGLAPGVNSLRYTFDSLYLFDGIPLAVFALGMFAIPEMVDLLVARRAVSTEAELSSGRLDGIRDAWQHRWLVLRSSFLGSVLGVIPGIGGSVIDWITYGVTQQTVKDSSQFGKGDIRGVLGPESANSAKEGGALIPTLLFSVPGSGTTAILLGGLMLLGLQAGPSMIQEDLPVTLSIVWSLSIANVIATAFCLVLTKWAAKLTAIPAQRLVPFLMVLMVVAAYQSTRHWGDIIVLFVIGIVAWVMKQIGWPRPPMLIGFVLALPSERYLHLSISRYQLDWLTRPGVIAIFALTFVLVVGGAVFQRRSSLIEPEIADEVVE